jgi:hypothetical protein
VHDHSLWRNCLHTHSNQSAVKRTPDTSGGRLAVAEQITSHQIASPRAAAASLFLGATTQFIIVQPFVESDSAPGMLSGQRQNAETHARRSVGLARRENRGVAPRAAGRCPRAEQLLGPDYAAQPATRACRCGVGHLASVRSMRRLSGEVTTGVAHVVGAFGGSKVADEVAGCGPERLEVTPRSCARAPRTE